MKLTIIRRHLPGALSIFAPFALALFALAGVLAACEPTATEQTGLSADEAEGPPTSTTQRPGVDEDWDPHGGGPPTATPDDDVNPEQTRPPADWQQREAIERPGDQGPDQPMGFESQQGAEQQGVEQQGVEQQPQTPESQGGIEEQGGGPAVTPDAGTTPREDPPEETVLPQRPYRTVPDIDEP